MKTLFKALLSALVVISAVPSMAEVAVIVNPDNTNTMTQQQVRKLFLGKVRTFPDGAAVEALDLPSGNAVRADFLDKVLRKTEANLNAHWARMLFSSKGKPPKTVNSTQEVINTVASSTNAIGYINADKVDGSVKVLMIIK